MRPPIWRLEVPAMITLAGLQAVLQAAFGWTDGHLHRFEVSARGRRPRLNPARVARRHRRRPAGLPLRLRRRLDPPHKGQGRHAAGDLRRGRVEPAPARHRLRRPVPDPPHGQLDPDRGDATGPARRREGTKWLRSKPPTRLDTTSRASSPTPNWPASPQDSASNPPTPNRPRADGRGLAQTAAAHASRAGKHSGE
jgi:hypothetical protein